MTTDALDGAVLAGSGTVFTVLGAWAVFGPWAAVIVLGSVALLFAHALLVRGG